MILDRYDLRSGKKFTTFEFVSIGKKGSIKKIIQFQETVIPNVYNLAFGDLYIATGDLDDKAVTDNGDSEKVLATVVASLYSFLNHYPGMWVYATGSTAARTRLYRMGINKYFDIVEKDFNMIGEHLGQWESYTKGKDYQAFAIQLKTINFNI